MQSNLTRNAARYKSEEIQLKHLRRLVFLSALFFISGLLFFFMQTILYRSAEPLPEYNQTQVESLGLEPVDLSQFQIFTYRPNMGPVLVEGACKDKFYAVIIYPQNINYRQSPQDARYNVANPCPPSKHFQMNLPLSSPPFESGQKYYVIRADQGNKGVWYNPH